VKDLDPAIQDLARRISSKKGISMQEAAAQVKRFAAYGLDARSIEKMWIEEEQSK